jgi:hypothetical protein
LRTRLLLIASASLSLEPRGRHVVAALAAAATAAGVGRVAADAARMEPADDAPLLADDVDLGDANV